LFSRNVQAASGQAVPRVSSLFETCTAVMARDFIQVPNYKDLPPKFRHGISNLLRPDQTLPIDLAVSCVDDEEYWKRCAQHKYENCQLAQHGNSWKQLYCEKYIKEVVEEYDPAVSDLGELKKLLSALQSRIRGLSLSQLPSHLDMAILFEHLQNLNSLALTYDMRNVGMNYERSLFGMKMADCVTLSRSLPLLQSLTSLNLSRNTIDDEKVRMVAQGLADNFTVTTIDLSHNRIADRGVRALARILADKCVIDTLDLSDNQIHTGGGKALGKALRKNDTLQVLNLRLNRLGDEGGRLLFEGMLSNSTLQTLNVSSNALEVECARAIAAVGRSNEELVLCDLDLSSNPLTEEGGRLLRDLDANRTLTRMDLRETGIGVDNEAVLIEIVKRNEKEALAFLKQKGTGDDYIDQRGSSFSRSPIPA